MFRFVPAHPPTPRRIGRDDRHAAKSVAPDDKKGNLFSLRVDGDRPQKRRGAAFNAAKAVDARQGRERAPCLQVLLTIDVEGDGERVPRIERLWRRRR